MYIFNGKIYSHYLKSFFYYIDLHFYHLIKLVDFFWIIRTSVVLNFEG